MEVVAAIILRDNRFLIARRPEGKARPLLWEFPGGKVECGETHQQALRRECREELGIDIRMGRQFMQVRHTYPDITVHLYVYAATIAFGEPCALEHQELAWVTPEELPQYAFCPADRVILLRLRENHGHYADLHLHSQFSDGTQPVEAIVKDAAARGIGTLALCDHNQLDGIPAARAACRKAGMRFITGVELNALNGVQDVHILAYGFREGDPAFQAYVRRNRALLDDLSTRLIRAMHADGHTVSPDDYDAFPVNPALGGWKAMQYLKSRGFGESLTDVVAWYNRYGCSYDTAGFPDVADTIRHIHAAHGKAILAHPQESGGRRSHEEFLAWFARMTLYGFDGVECYHPRQTEESTRQCLAYCRDNGLIITAGSDAHGDFGSAQMGELLVRADDLSLHDMTVE